MPGVYADGEMDLAGFVVGVVEKGRLLEPSRVQQGDKLLGIPSSGLHTNGFSLVRKVFGTDDDPAALFRRWDGLNHTLGEELLLYHRNYYPMLAPAVELLSGLAHITGRRPPRKTACRSAGPSRRFNQYECLDSVTDFRPDTATGKHIG